MSRIYSKVECARVVTVLWLGEMFLKKLNVEI